MSIASEFSNREIRPVRDGKDPMGNGDHDGIETVFVGEPGLDQHLAAEGKSGHNQYEVDRISPNDMNKENPLGALASGGSFNRQEEIKTMREIVTRLSAEGGADQIMEVKNISDLDIEGEKFTITESNQDEVKKILVDRGYEIVDLVHDNPGLGFRAKKVLIEDGSSDLDLVFLISKEK